MGEHVEYKGETIKIGTCENMYYLRADQVHLIEGYEFEFNVDRFRFPFPDEDDIEPGQFEGPEHRRGWKIPGYRLPAELSGDEHGNVQFTSTAGYVLSIPCPEQFGQPGLTVHVPLTDEPEQTVLLRVGRNGFNGQPVVSQQAWRNGLLVTMLRCGACRAIHRLDTLEDAAPVAQAFRDEAMREEWSGLNQMVQLANSSSSIKAMLDMADRIEAGYAIPVGAA